VFAPVCINKNGIIGVIMAEENDVIKEQIVKQEHSYRLFHTALTALVALGSIAAFVVLVMNQNTARVLWFPVVTGLISVLALMEK
jgi:hypothetical protein